MENYKLLVVDDAFFIRNLVKKAVSNKPTNENFSISVIGEAKNTEEAIEFCKTECPDIITVDYQMPPGPNGLELIKTLKTSYPNIMFLMIADDKIIEKEANELGSTFIVKPFKEEEIWTALDKTILFYLKSKTKQSEVSSTDTTSITTNIVNPKVEEKKEEFAEAVIINKKENTEKSVEVSIQKKKKKKKKKKKHQVDDDFGFEVVGTLNKTTTLHPEISTPQDNAEIKTVVKTTIPEEVVVKEIDTTSTETWNEETVKETLEPSIHKETVVDNVNREVETDKKTGEQVDTNIKEHNIEEKTQEVLELDVNEIMNDSLNDTVEETTSQYELSSEDYIETDDELKLDFNTIINEDDYEEDTLDINELDKNETVDVDNEKNPEFEETYISKAESKRIEEAEEENLEKTEDDEPYYIEEDEADNEVFTFFEEDESAYEDKTIESFNEDNKQVKTDIIEEEKTDDDEIADLIKEASYSFDENEEVLPEKTTNSQLNINSDYDDPDIYVNLNIENTEDKKSVKDDIEEKSFDEQLEEFEDSEEFRTLQERTEEEDLFDKELEDSDVETFSLDDLENETFNLDDTQTSTSLDDIIKQDVEREKQNREDSLSQEDDLNFEDIDKEFSTETEDYTVDNLIEDTFNLENTDTVDKPFDLDDDKTFDNNLLESERTSTSTNDFDKYFENEEDDTLPIFDTQELPVSEIIKRNQEVYKQQNEDIMPPTEVPQKNDVKIKKNRPDGTNVKQKESFFGRLFKKK